MAHKSLFLPLATLCAAAFLLLKTEPQKTFATTARSEQTVEEPSFNYFDSDSDGKISEEEFGMGLFQIWGGNGNDRIESDEWERHYLLWGVPLELNTIPDPNGVERDAFIGWYTDTRLFENWDIDGNNSISRQEYVQSREQFKMHPQRESTLRAEEKVNKEN